MGNVFQFQSSASLEKLTGKKADTLADLLDLIRTCDYSSIFYHTFSAYMKMREIQLPYNSDFAIWIAKSLNEKALAERLMAIDLSEYNTLESLKVRLIEIIEDYSKRSPEALRKTADEPFYLYDIVRVVYLTDKFAYDLESFRDVLETISIYSIYFHFIESRIEEGLQADHFTIWIEESLGLRDLARLIRKIDFNVYTLEGLRSRIIKLIDEYSKQHAGGGRWS